MALTREAGRAVVAVEVTGPGIPGSKREKVFDAFYRIEASRNPEVGLGLSVPRSISHEHGGDIVFGARKGGGFNARLDLPV